MAANDVFLCIPEAPNGVKLYDPAVGCGGSTAWTQNLSDTVTLSEDLVKSVVQSLNDTTTLSEAIVKGTGKNQSDSVTLSEALIKGFGSIQSDSIALSELISKGINIFEVDTVNLSDVPTPTLTPGGTAWFQSLSDSVTLSDLVTLTIASDVVIGNAHNFLPLQSRKSKRAFIRNFIKEGINNL